MHIILKTANTFNFT